MLLSTEIKKAIIECHFLGLSDTTKNQYPSGNVRKCANASIMWLIFDNVSTTFLFNVALLFHAIKCRKIFPGRGEGGVWRFLDIISFWCRATDLHLLKRELNFAVRILFILLVDRRWKPKVSLAHLLTEDQLADFFSFWWLILALFLILTPRERLLILKYDPCVCTLCLFLSFAVHLFWNWQSLWSGFHTSLSRQQAWRYWSLFAFYPLPLVSGQCLVL